MTSLKLPGAERLIVALDVPTVDAALHAVETLDNVSPGIRPDGATTDDHKRHTTPAEAIRFGADYLVVGRPILRAADPRDAAERVIREIDAALPTHVAE